MVYALLMLWIEWICFFLTRWTITSAHQFLIHSVTKGLQCLGTLCYFSYCLLNPLVSLSLECACRPNKLVCCGDFVVFPTKDLYALCVLFGILYVCHFWCLLPFRLYLLVQHNVCSFVLLLSLHLWSEWGFKHGPQGIVCVFFNHAKY